MGAGTRCSAPCSFSLSSVSTFLGGDAWSFGLGNAWSLWVLSDFLSHLQHGWGQLSVCASCRSQLQFSLHPFFIFPTGVVLARLECRVSSHSGRPVCGSLHVASPHLQQCDRMWKSDLNKGLACLPINLSLVWGATEEGGSLSLRWRLGEKWSSP